MPSLIYITRIQSPSAELSQVLESSGVHVKSFGPGEITADECVLVMTSEAVRAGVRGPGAESRGTSPLDAIPKHLGGDAAIWNYIKASKVSESSAVEGQEVSGQQTSVSMTVPAPLSLGFVASQAGVRALAASRLLPATQKKSLETSDGGRASRPSGRAETPGPQTLMNRADQRPPQSLWRAAALVAVLSAFAMMLLTGRDPILPVREIAAVENGKPGERPDPSAADAVEKAFAVTSSAKPSNPAAEPRQRVSDYDFVAEDYITRFDRHSHPGTTTQAPDLSRRAPNRQVRKRVVID